MYRESPTSVERKAEEKRNIFERLLTQCFLLVYFVFLPIVVTVIVNWLTYSFAADNFYQETWMMPALLLFSTFLAGAFIRQKIEDEMGGMGLFVLAIIALMIFAYLTDYDIHKIGGVYSQFMPKYFRTSIADYVLMLPGVGIVGMLFYKYFTLKHYN